MSLRTIAVIDAKKCTGCALCELSCRRQAIHMNGNGIAVVDKDKCTGCGLCVNECPGGAISLLTGV
ncbi:MAG: 4Fe-4S binding protein [Deltaproteobacteria bacterium]|nr:4Fe-4S binding protein [Deltaproteobacteria bacterium]